MLNLLGYQERCKSYLSVSGTRPVKSGGSFVWPSLTWFVVLCSGNLN